MTHPVPKPVRILNVRFLALVRAQPCAICRAQGLTQWLLTQAAHLRVRKNAGDAYNVVPLCVEHHRYQHDHGIETFKATCGVDLLKLARDLWEAYCMESDLCPVTGAPYEDNCRRSVGCAPCQQGDFRWPPF